MPQVVAAIAAFAATTFVIVGVSVTGAFLIQAAIVTAAMAFTYMAAKNAQALGDTVRGRQEMVRQPISPRRKIYGNIRVSGPMHYAGTTGVKNKFLYIGILLASTRIFSIGAPLINDEVLAGSKYDSLTTVETTNLGTDGQAASTLLLEVPEYLSTDKLSGIAHLPVKFKADQEVFAGLPVVKSDVQGALIYDPREDSTNGGAGLHRLNDPDTWEYSTNSILCIADYYKDDVVGMGLDTTDLIHWPTIITQADICDEVVTKAGGSGTENRYTFNGTVLSNQNPGDVLPDMLTSCSGTIVNNLEGDIYIYAGAWDVPTVTLTEDDLAGELQIIDKQSRANLYNYISGTYYNGTTHQPDEFPSVTEAAFIVEDGDEELRTSIELPYTNGGSEGQRIANNELQRGRDQSVVIFPANIEALQLTAHNTVFLTLDFYGYNADTFRIIDYALDIPNGVVLLTLKAETASTWTWTAGDFSAVTANAASTFPDFSTIIAPVLDTPFPSAALADDGTIISVVDLTFSQPADKAIIDYEIEYKPSADTIWAAIGTVRAPIDTDDVSTLGTRISGLRGGEDFDFRVRSRNNIGKKSTYSIQSVVTAAVDTTAPSVPTGLTLTGNISVIKLNWINPSEDDFNAIKIYRRTNSTSPSESDLLQTLSGDRSKVSLYFDSVTTTTTFFYWIRSVDRSGNESALTALVTGAASSISSEGAVWDSNISGQPSDAALLNAQQDWQDVSGTGIPDDDADVTGSNTALNIVSQGALATLAQVAAAQIASNAVETVKILDEAVSLLDAVQYSGIVNKGSQNTLDNTTPSATETVMSESFTVNDASALVHVSGIVTIGWGGTNGLAGSDSSNQGVQTSLLISVGGVDQQSLRGPYVAWTSSGERDNHSPLSLTIPFDFHYNPPSTGSKTVVITVTYTRARAGGTVKVEPSWGNRAINWQEVKK